MDNSLSYKEALIIGKEKDVNCREKSFYWAYSILSKAEGFIRDYEQSFLHRDGSVFNRDNYEDYRENFFHSQEYVKV